LTGVGHVQLLVDNGKVYESHGNELKLHNYHQLEAKWQTGHYDDRLGFETTPGPRMTPTGEDAAEDAAVADSERRDGSKWCGSSEQRGRHTTCPSTPPLSRWSSRQVNSLSAQLLTPPRDHFVPLR